MRHYELKLIPDTSYANGLNIGVHYAANPAVFHRHSEFELNFMERGNITYLFGGERVVLKEHQCMLFWASIPHQLLIADDDAILHWVTVPLDVFLQWRLHDEMTQQIMCGKSIIDYFDAPPPAIMSALQQWHIALKEKAASSFYAEYQKIVLLELEAYMRRFALSFYMDDKQEQTGQLPQTHELDKMEQMACFIAEHYTEMLHVNDIAQAVHLHPNYAMHVFRKRFGMSMLEYVTQYRLAHAQRLLITTEKTTSEIALSAGFGSVSRFYAAFKAAHGFAPAQYRAMLGN